ncbi:DUF58 domain-containing protein [Halalkalibacter akibai]|uniref:DUF58 domain-containing protein n=1 Tax=Halalkalibacter akibai (strain ATCC 43226 / DSM 21942 / CIP 109018 / JCM 9157 / 1139) TaxID=1236973 RepID=W4QZH6_HALA3|nr:DUF58 domain-containing protein [Halalkalibacter akibai]GAE37530.1 hypothetical protein JCM9157_4839 [Halalkalibacter akibai JCM 9157]
MRWSKLRPYLKFLLLVAFVLIVFSYAMFQGGFVSWFLFYSVISVIVSTILIAIFPFRVVRAERKVNEEVLQASEQLLVTVTITKKALQPFFYVRVRDVVPENLGNYDETGSLFFFSFQRKLTFTYSVSQLKRGEHSFDEITLIFGDLFGLFERTSKIKCETTVLVYPRLQKLNEIPHVGSPKQLEGFKNKRSFEEDRSLAGVRQYVPGDRLTMIDWKQSARSNQLMTKEFESYQGEGVIVALDTFFKEGAEKFEHTVILAASLMASFAKKQSSPSLAVRIPDWLSLNITQRTVGQGLRLLAKVTPETTPTPIIHKIYRDWEGMHVYYVCSDLDRHFIKVAKTLREQGANVTICMPGLTQQDRLISKEIEKMGISVHEFNEK